MVAATDTCVLGSEFEMEAFAKFLKHQLATLPAQTEAPKPKSSSKTCIVLLVVVVWCLLFMLLVNNDEL